MKIVDTVEIHVFSVPGKTGLPHPKVEVSRVDSRNTHTVLITDGVQYGVEGVHVPHCHILVIKRSRDVCSVERRIEGDIPPVLAL